MNLYILFFSPAFLRFLSLRVVATYMFNLLIATGIVRAQIAPNTWLYLLNSPSMYSSIMICAIRVLESF